MRKKYKNRKDKIKNGCKNNNWCYNIYNTHKLSIYNEFNFKRAKGDKKHFNEKY